MVEGRHDVLCRISIPHPCICDAVKWILQEGGGPAGGRQGPLSGPASAPHKMFPLGLVAGQRLGFLGYDERQSNSRSWFIRDIHGDDFVYFYFPRSKVNWSLDFQDCVLPTLGAKRHDPLFFKIHAWLRFPTIARRQPRRAQGSTTTIERRWINQGHGFRPASH